MSQEIGATVHGYGYAFCELCEPELSTEQFAQAIGKPFCPPEGRMVQELCPREEGTPNTYTGIYGLARFPFHTDLAHWSRPPRYLLLRCLRGYADVPTFVFDSSWLIDEIGSSLMHRALFRARRPRGEGFSLFPILEETDDGRLFRWDEMFIVPASKIGKKIHSTVRERMRTCISPDIALHATGDTLILDNWRMLHARSPVPLGCRERKIERVYLEEVF